MLVFLGKYYGESPRVAGTKKAPEGFEVMPISLRICWVSTYHYFPGFFYCRVDVDQVALLIRQFF
ncbi:hypothetical protein J9874_04088 (plasmid) [Duffyella gerundensis]|nr:hypothetical protein J9874_04088 [Duffyella gerundensis]